jgi:hypothetical protein
MTEGVVLLPSAFGMTTGSFPSITETHELVVPKSIPIILLITLFLYFDCIQALCHKDISDTLSYSFKGMKKILQPQ